MRRASFKRQQALVRARVQRLLGVSLSERVGLPTVRLREPGHSIDHATWRRGEGVSVYRGWPCAIVAFSNLLLVFRIVHGGRRAVLIMGQQVLRR